MNNTAPKHFDLVIVGTGLVGTSLALLLVDSGLSIAIVEAREFSPRTNPLGKALALSYASYKALNVMGVWPQLANYATPIEHVHVSEKGRFHKTRLDATKAQLPALGYLINEPILATTLHEALTKVGCHWFCPATVTAINNEQDRAELTLQTTDNANAIISADLVIAVDGQRSPIRQMLDIDVSEQDYQQQALVARLKISGSHNNTAYERFTKMGTIAIMPQPGQEVALIVSGANAVIDDWLALSDTDFIARLQQYFGYHVGRFTSLGERLHYPLKAVIAKEQVHKQVVLAGNAAHSIHPVAAQGLNLSLHDVTILAELLKTAVANKTAINDTELLTQYLELITPHQQQVLGMTQKVVDMFHTQNSIASVVRQLGLAGFEYSDFLKRQIINRGAGLSGYVAKILRD